MVAEESGLIDDEVDLMDDVRLLDDELLMDDVGFMDDVGLMEEEVLVTCCLRCAFSIRNTETDRAMMTTPASR